jgi:hypothetical protein
MIISKNRAKEICSNWHNGQWSALYQFGSSGVFLIESTLIYLKEVQECLEPEYNLHPSSLSKAHEKELNSLKNFFLFKAREVGLIIEFNKHNIYGYQIPCIKENLHSQNLKSLKLLI